MRAGNLGNSVYAWLARIIKYSAVVSAVAAAVILLMSVIDVIGSKFFGWGLPGAFELTEELNLVLVFMAVAYVQLDRGHMRVNLLETYIPAGLKHALALAGQVIGTVVCGFFSWRALVLLQDMIVSSEYRYGRINFPLWPFGLIYLFGFTLLTVAFILSFGKGIVAGPAKK